MNRIYLIGGAPRCGKSTVAKNLSKKLAIPWISSDALEHIASVYIPKSQHKTFFPKYIVRRKTKFSNDLMYNRYSAKEITRLYMRQSRSTFPAIRALMENAEKEGDSFIIEGHQVQPKLIAEIRERYGKTKVRALVLVRQEVDAIVKGCKLHKSKNDWCVQKTEKEETYRKIAQMIADYSRYLEKQAKRYGIKSIRMDEDFKGRINEVINSF